MIKKIWNSNYAKTKRMKILMLWHYSTYLLYSHISEKKNGLHNNHIIHNLFIDILYINIFVVWDELITVL